jgi:hypothetical protein
MLRSLGVAEESDLGEVRRLASDLPYTIVMDERASVLREWGVMGYPATFVVDAEGPAAGVLERSPGASWRRRSAHCSRRLSSRS